MLKTIKLKNFKCFKQINIPLSSVNLLSGLNGMGKSTVVQSLLLLRQSFEQNLLDRELALNGNLVNIGTGRDLLYEYAEQPERIEIILEMYNEGINSWSYVYKPESDVLKIHDKRCDEELTNFSLFNNNFEYICAERLGPRNLYPKSSMIVSEKQQLGIAGEYTGHYLLLYGDKSISNIKAKCSESSDSSLTYQVQYWLNEVSPGIKLSFEDYRNADSVGLQYRIDGIQISKNHRPSNVGFGVTYILPVIVALLKAKLGDLIIIENPEAHLHPQGQRKIGELIARVASGGVQIIVESHSDHVLNGIRLSVRNGLLPGEKVKLHFFEKQSSETETYHKITSPSIKSDGRLTMWPNGFFDEWDKALEELF